jgi:hypothetical protein
MRGQFHHVERRPQARRPGCDARCRRLMVSATLVVMYLMDFHEEQGSGFHVTVQSTLVRVADVISLSVIDDLKFEDLWTVR